MLLDWVVVGMVLTVVIECRVSDVVGALDVVIPTTHDHMFDSIVRDRMEVGTPVVVVVVVAADISILVGNQLVPVAR